MKNMKKAVSLFAILSISLLASCGGKTDKTSSKPNTSESGSAVEGDFYVTYKGQEVDAGSTLDVVIGDKVCILVPRMEDNSEPEFTFTSSDPTIVTVGEHNGLLNGVKAGNADVTVALTSDASSSAVFHITVADKVVSSGAFSYATASYEEKANILASLEKYAVDNYLTGITMFSNGSNICYNTRYVPTPNSYVTGYGWGTMREGKLKGNISNPISGNNAALYQVATTSLPSHANAMNASGSDVSDIYTYISNSYYQSRLNQAANGYEWYSNTALDDKPIPIDDNGNEITDTTNLTNTRWRIHVKTGGDFVYRTASTATKESYKTGKPVNIASFDGRQVTLEDYLTPIKFMLTGYNGQYRGSEQTDGVSGFANAADYYAKTSKQSGTKYSYYDEDAWKKSNMDKSIKTGTDEKGGYIEFNLLQPCTQFYAMYYLSSSLYSPLPAEFIEIWGPKDLGKSPDGFSPKDTMLSTGAYYITEWDKKRITFTKNDQYFYKKDTFKDGNTRDVYNFPGFQYNEVEDSTISKNLFLSGSIDSYAPNKDDLKGDFSASSGSGKGMEWRKYETKGDSNFKLNINATTMDEWKARFGTTGTVYQHDSSFIADTGNNKFLKTRDIMSDIHFLNFLSFGMDRKTICESRGMKATQEYFSDNYLIDPETGVSYNSTDAHKAVLADRYNDTYGYNREAATAELKTFFETTVKELVSKNKLPTKDNKKVIEITMNWMNPSDTKDYGDVFDSIKEIFNSYVSKYQYGGYTLIINEPGPSSDYNEVYDKMKRGEFDLGFGAVSGGALDPINFMEVLKSDNSSSFTLNWGPDTSKISDSDQGDVVYDGKVWSFDSLWNAANTGVLLNKDGSMANATNVSKSQSGGLKYESINAERKSVTYKLSFKQLVEAGAVIKKVNATNSEYATISTLAELGATAENGYVGTLTLDSGFNEYQSDGKTVSSPIATITVSYSVEIGGVTKTFSTSVKLMTYVGIAANE